MLKKRVRKAFHLRKQKKKNYKRSSINNSMRGCSSYLLGGKIENLVSFRVSKLLFKKHKNIVINKYVRENCKNTIYRVSKRCLGHFRYKLVSAKVSFWGKNRIYHTHLCIVWPRYPLGVILLVSDEHPRPLIPGVPSRVWEGMFLHQL